MSTAVIDDRVITLSTPLGVVRIHINGRFVTSLDIASGKSLRQRQYTFDPIYKELQAYFANPHHHFTLPLQLNGTSFQRQVWRAMQRIPAGQTRTYGEIAQALQSSPRAVGNACRANPIPIIIPCHRVVAANGLGGYSGQTHGRQIDIKRWLLAHEGVASL